MTAAPIITLLQAIFCADWRSYCSQGAASKANIMNYSTILVDRDGCSVANMRKLAPWVHRTLIAHVNLLPHA